MNPLILMAFYILFISANMTYALIEKFGMLVWLAILIGLAIAGINILIIMLGIIFMDKTYLGWLLSVYSITFFSGVPLYILGKIELFAATVKIPILGFAIIGIHMLIDYIDYKIYEYRKKKVNKAEAAN